jgi:hypothetical protein
MMLAEMVPTKVSGTRLPPNRPPKVKFSPDPDDRDRDMFLYLRDNIKLLIASLADVTVEQVATYIELLDQRRRWIKEEMEVERMMEEIPGPPLGIESDPYDLGELANVQRNFRREKFEELLRVLDQAQMSMEQRFWEQIWPSNPSS